MPLFRFVVRLVALAAVLLGALALHGLWRLARRPSPWPRRFLDAVARIAGARSRIVGTPLARDVVFVANHQSWLDILVLAGATGTTFVAKGELADAPLVGWLCTLNHTIFVARAERMAVAAQIARITDALAAGHPVALFPEGTTGDGTALLPFKPTLLAALDDPPQGVCVQPVRIDYGDATPHVIWTGDEPGAANARRVLSRPGTFDVTLHFCDPFDPTGMGRKAIAAEARRRIEAAVEPAANAH